jgi:hypothetical protein
MSAPLTQDRLRELLHYDPETGIWRNLITRSPRALAGSIAGYINIRGYRIIRAEGRLYRSARLAHLYMTGVWPPAEMDHKEGVRDDDRWSQLRPATRAQNTANPHPKQRPLPKGVYANGNRFQAQIRINGSNPRRLGTYRTSEEAAAAYRGASIVVHGEFARTS